MYKFYINIFCVLKSCVSYPPLEGVGGGDLKFYQLSEKF